LTDESVLDVGVIDGSAELEEGEFEGKLFGEIDVDDELGSLVGTGYGTVYGELPVIQIFLDRGVDSSK